MESVTYIIQNNSANNAEKGYIQLLPTRSEIFNIVVDKVSALKIADFGFNINFKGKLKPKDKVSITINFTGEVPTLDYVDYQGKTKELKLDTFTIEKSSPVSFDSDEVYNNHIKRIKLIDKIEDPFIKKAQEFFAFYDYQTLPPLVDRNPDIPTLEKQKRKQIIMSTVGILTNRVLIRGQFAINFNIPPTNKLPSVQKEWVIYLSDLQKLIYNQFFLKDGQPNIEGIENSFDLFANGDLRLNDQGIRNGEPDSAFEFSFAEWALVAIENDVDTDFWKPIVPKLIKSQVIFMKVYKPDIPGPYKYNDYTSANFNENKKVTKDFKKDLSAKYATLTFDEIILEMGKNAFEAFRANYGVA